MKQRQFNLKIDDPTKEALKALAAALHRSQASVIRWLVLTEAAKLGGQGKPVQPAAPEAAYDLTPS